MSASGIGPFENDDAMDLLDELRDIPASEVIVALETAISSAAQVAPGDYLDRDLGEPAIAASAIILARANGRDEILEEIGLAGIVPEVPARLFPQVASALSRTLEDDSEIHGLWVDAGAGEAWRAGVEQLLREAKALTGGK